MTLDMYLNRLSKYGFDTTNYFEPIVPEIEVEDEKQFEADISHDSSEAVVKYMRTFFEKCNYHLGGPIPESALLTERNIEIVLRLNLDECIQLFYNLLAAHRKSKGESDEVSPLSVDVDDSLNDLYDEDSRLLTQLHNKASALDIPKDYAGGLILVWLAVCCGIDV